MTGKAKVKFIEYLLTQPLNHKIRQTIHPDLFYSQAGFKLSDALGREYGTGKGPHEALYTYRQQNDERLDT